MAHVKHLTCRTTWTRRWWQRQIVRDRDRARHPSNGQQLCHGRSRDCCRAHRIGQKDALNLHGSMSHETEEIMSTIRTILRPVFVLGIAVAGVQALGAISAGPAEASCGHRGCAFRSHAGPSSSFRPGPSIHAPASTGHRIGSQKIGRSNSPAAMQISPHGVTVQANVPGISLSPRGPAPTLASGPRSPGTDFDSRGLSRSPQPVDYRPTSTLTPPNTPTPTQGNPNPSVVKTNGPLTAIPACVTPQGQCVMPQRALGTACQCADQRGNTYNGVVQ
jgi:hypothetical protein